MLNYSGRLFDLELRSVTLKFVDEIDIHHPDGTVGKADASSTGTEIRMVRNPKQDGMFLLNHEALHVLKTLNKFTDKEWATLESAARLEKQPVNNGLPENIYLEEIIADMFAKYAQSRFRFFSFAPSMRKIFKKIESGEIGSR